MAILTGVTNKRFDAASLAALLVKIKASHDAIMGSLIPEQYIVTTDTELVDGKTYYTEADGVYTAVETPSVDNIASYYEVSVPAETRDYNSLIELERAIKTAAEDADNDFATLLNSKVVEEAGKFVKNISFADGKIKADLQGLASADQTIVIDEYDLSVNIDGVTLQKDATSGEISVVKNAVVELVELNETELAALGENNVQTAYKLIAVGDDDRTAIGDFIKVAKDSSVKDVHIGVEADGEDAQKLYLTYVLDDGSESKVSVDFSSFIAEAEMGNGLVVVDHKVSIKIDDASEAFLTVGEGGLKLDGVQMAIDAAKAEAIATVLGETNAAQYILTADTELVDGKTYYTEADGVYTAVETPSVDNIASYYEVSVPAETRDYNTLIEVERALKNFSSEINEQVDANVQALGEIVDAANAASFTEPTETAVDTTYTIKFVGEEAVNEILRIINDVKKASESSASDLNDKIDAAKAEAIATVLGETNTGETREYNTLIEAERAIETLQAEKAALQDVVDSLNNTMTADDVNAAWEAAGL